MGGPGRIERRLCRLARATMSSAGARPPPSFGGWRWMVQLCSRTVDVAGGRRAAAPSTWRAPASPTAPLLLPEPLRQAQRVVVLDEPGHAPRPPPPHDAFSIAGEFSMSAGFVRQFGSRGTQHGGCARLPRCACSRLGPMVRHAGVRAGLCEVRSSTKA